MIEYSLTDQEIKSAEDEDGKSFFSCRFNFLKVHCGIRPACLHMFLGTKGSGKSSLVKTIIADIARVKTVAVWLTEETKVQYQKVINSISKSAADNIRWIAEKSLDHKNNRAHGDFLKMAEREILDANSDILFIDNISTGRFYQNEKTQMESAEWFSSFPQRSGMAVVAVAHTRKDVTDNSYKLIDGTDIRGRLDITNVCEYLYALQKFEHDDGWHLIVNIDKSRHHRLGGSKYFLPEFNDGIYWKDSALPFDALNEIYKNRQYLGKRS